MAYDRVKPTYVDSLLKISPPLNTYIAVFNFELQMYHCVQGHVILSETRCSFLYNPCNRVQAECMESDHILKILHLCLFRLDVKVNVKQSSYRPKVAQRVPGS